MKSWQAMDSIMTDALLLIGWGDREDVEAYRQSLQKDSVRTIKRLKEQITIAKAQKAPESLKSLKHDLVKTLYACMNIHEDIGKESDEKTKEDFERFYEQLDLLSDNFNDALRAYLTIYDFPDWHQEIDEELVYFKTREDQQSYEAARDLMKRKEYHEALKILESLLPAYAHTPTEDILTLRITDCYLMFNSDIRFEEPEEYEKIFAKLARIVDGNRYSPILRESFLKWRATYQSRNHGMSNFSVIPNDEYNMKRWHALDVIVEHIEKNPQDHWARLQAFLLAIADNINRGLLHGNTNIVEKARLYSDIIDRMENNE